MDTLNLPWYLDLLFGSMAIAMLLMVCGILVLSLLILCDVIREFFQ